MTLTLVTVDYDYNEPRGWCYANAAASLKSSPAATYYAAIAAAVAAKHEIDNAGWRHRMLLWNFHAHQLDGYPEWEISSDGRPSFVRLALVRGTGPGEAHKLAQAWDDLATADFYERIWTDDALPCVAQGDTYWSGWWFATIADRDRFVAWIQVTGGTIEVIA